MKLIGLATGFVIWMGFVWCPMASAQTTFVKHTIATIGQPLDVTVGDINGDGQLDLATVSVANGEVAWWENNGQGGYSKKQIKTGFDGGRTIRAGDIDGDGDTDLIAASISLHRIEWYENDGSQKFTVNNLDLNFRGAHTVQLTDLDQDGDLDILCSGWDNTLALSEVAWWENKGGKVFTKHLVSSQLDQSPFVEATDMDLDGDLDLIGSDETPGEVYWWENNGSQVYSEHLIDNQFTLAHTVLARDIDKDGDPDILASATSSSLLAWYENTGSGTFKKHAMDNLGGAIWLDMADFDLDGDNDMIATGMAATTLALYSNNGRQNFSKSVVSGGITSGFALSINDLDQDGDPDVVAIGYNSNFLGWWENKADNTTLLQSPSWLIRGAADEGFLVVNSEKGNIIATTGIESARGVANPVYCQGIALVNNLLYANSGSALQAYHPVSGNLVGSYRTDAQYLLGLTTGPSGMLYLSAPLDGNIYSFDPVAGLITTIAGGLEFPQALRYDPLSGEILVLDGEDRVTVKSIDPASGGTTIWQVTEIPAGGDIEVDGSGNFYLSSPSSNTIYANTSGWSSPTVVYLDNLQGPWGLCYDGEAKELVVAMTGTNRLERVAATATGIGTSPADRPVSASAWPNPFVSELHIRIPVPLTSAAVLKIVSPDGRLIWSRSSSTIGNSRGISELEITLTEMGSLPAGLYFLIYSDGPRSSAVPVVHEAR
jgi:hypothetical protein